MSLIPTTGKVRSFADVVLGRGKAPEPPVPMDPSKTAIGTECFLLTRCPLEIRENIWEDCFLRPAGIVPGRLNWARYDDDPSSTETYIYDGSPFNAKNCRIYRSFTHTWTTDITYDQKMLVSNGESELPDTIDEAGRTIKHSIHNRPGHKTEVINSCLMCLPSIGSSYTYENADMFGLFRVCKQISAEVSALLYGRNKFVFDSRGNAEKPFSWDEKQSNEFDRLRNCVPGLLKSNHKQISLAIDRMFNKEIYQPKFLFEDHLIRFFRKIGRKNASLIKKVKIAGHFKIRYRDYEHYDNHLVGLATLLPIYSTILKEVCPNLTHLTLHMGRGDPTLFTGKNSPPQAQTNCQGLELYDDFPEDRGKTDDDKIDCMVQRVVEALPSLLHLQLGDYKEPAVPEGDLPWGKSLRWVEFVESRARQNGERNLGGRNVGSGYLIPERSNQDSMEHNY